MDEYPIADTAGSQHALIKVVLVQVNVYKLMIIKRWMSWFPRFAFEALMLNEVVSFTSVLNRRSRAVMERLGMIDTHRNFKHPALVPDHFLQLTGLVNKVRRLALETKETPSSCRKHG